MAYCYCCDELPSVSNNTVCIPCSQLPGQDTLSCEHISEILKFLRSCGFKSITIRTVLLSAAVQIVLNVQASNLDHMVPNITGYEYQSLECLLDIIGRFTQSRGERELEEALRRHDTTASELFDVFDVAGVACCYPLSLLYMHSRWSQRDKDTSLILVQKLLPNFPKVYYVRKELETIAMLLPRLRGLAHARSTLGLSHLKSIMAPRIRCLRYIELKHDMPQVLARLVLCHELVHTNLWLSRPYRNTGTSSEEEILCHAVMCKYSDMLAAQSSPYERMVVMRRKLICIRDAAKRNSILWHRWRNVVEANGCGIFPKALTQENHISQSIKTEDN